MVTYRRALLTGLLLTVSGVIWGQSVLTEKIPIGAIFGKETEELQKVFKYAMAEHNEGVNSARRFEIQAYVDVINTADAFKLSRLICNQFALGVVAMLGAVTPDSFDILHSYTNTFQIPFITPWFPEKVIPPSSGLVDHAVSMRPDYHRAIIDTIVHYGWKEVIYVYDSHDGLLRLQQLYQTMHPTKTPFKITVVRRIYNASDAIDFLLVLEQLDRWNNKRIVLDCNMTNAKNILVEHVRTVQLGRRTYHYMLSDLIMDDHWEDDVTEYGALNITGFRIVDISKKYVKDFIEGFKIMNPSFRGTISAQTALMYDGVQVLIDTLGRFWKKRPETFRSILRHITNHSNTTKIIDCNPVNKTWIVPFEPGDKITRSIKKTDIEGLTGNISFNDRGHRCNFTLHVVEMTVKSATMKIATWSDRRGLTAVPSKYNQRSSPVFFPSNKTFIITTILQEPFMMMKPAEYGEGDDHYTGFCKDLADLIAAKLGIKYELHVVRDGMFGKEVSHHIWSGIVGEVQRKESDFAVAPLSINSDREQVIDFSEPYLTLEIPVKNTKNAKQLLGTFSFLRPLSKEIWLCVMFSFFAVSIVLFIVSRFSPHEWRPVSVSDTQLEHPISNTDEIILHNKFSIWNSFWFSLGSFMQQGSDVVPRSLSGRIVGTVWWFFALILVCSYTANLAAYLIVERMSQPVKCESITESPISNTDIVNDFDMNFSLSGDNRACSYKEVNFGVAIPKGSPLKEGINLAIVNLKRGGVLSKLWKKWLLTTNKPNCDILVDEEPTMSEMTLSQVSGVFYVLVCGLALALGVALIEFCQHGRAEAAKANVPLRAALRAKPRSSTQERKTRDQERLGWNGSAFSGYLASGSQVGQEETAHASFTHV